MKPISQGFENVRAVRIYDGGFRAGLLVKEGRIHDYVLTLTTPLRLTRISKGEYQSLIFSIPAFIEKLQERLTRASFKPGQDIINLLKKEV